MTQGSAYIIAARRTVIGRIGGLHARRRIEDLTAPVVTSVLGDCRINPSIVDGLILGNGTEPSNPARLVALAAGLPGATDAMTIDRQCAAGLDAIILACRAIEAGDAQVLVAGGAEALSTAPWRISRPKHLHQLPHFIGYEPVTSDVDDEPQYFAASERLAREYQLSRDVLDAAAIASHRAAYSAREQRRFVGEVVPLKHTPEEMRDELVRDVEPDDITSMIAYAGDGPLTPGNTSPHADGAALVVVVCPSIWKELGQPRALRYVRGASLGVSAQKEAAAAIRATERLIEIEPTLDVSRLAQIETSETSSAQVLAFERRFGVSAGIVNPAGGAVARGHPLAASGAVLAVRLYSDLVRRNTDTGSITSNGSRQGLATLSAIGGLGSAALFEAT